jgi:[ribosomal protein S18]-alanine N-acetyltransferase
MNSPSTIQVRRMTHADLDRVIAIEQSLTAAPHWPRSAYLSALDPQAAPPRIALVTELSNPSVIAGFAVASLIPPQAELESIAIAAELQHRGLARRLFSALAAELRAAQVAEVILELRASNHPALTLYRSLGFVESGRRIRYYHDPVEDALLMHMPL